MAMDIPGVSTPPAQGGHASGSIRRAGLIRAFGLLFASLLTACSNLAGPEYKRPDAPGKDTWLQEQSARSSDQEGIESEWWTGFEDPVLDELVSRAIAGNLDIRVLAARSDVARAAIGQARAGLLPTIEGGMATDTFKSTGVPSTTKYSTASEANWEIDIWGKVRKGVDASEAEFRATEADWRAGYLTLVSDVASAYFQIRQFDEQIVRQQAAIDRNLQILAVYQAMYDEGLIPKTQIFQQQAETKRLQNDLLELQRLRRLTENGLATLLGAPADDMIVPRLQDREMLGVVSVPAGLPSDLLTRRPDIIAAEYRVLKAHNLQGQARLAQLPSISLTGRGGSASFALSDLLKTGTFGLSSLVSFPIFDPNVRARIGISEAQTLLAEEEYRRTVVVAFEEVENALVNLSSRKAQRDELVSRHQYLETVSGEVAAQLEEGMVSQLEVFEVERTLIDAEQDMLANHWQILRDTVVLFKALGGGWPHEVVVLADQ